MRITLRKLRTGKVLDFWKSTVSKNPKHKNNHYDLTDESDWIISTKGVQQLVTEIEAINEEDDLRT